MILIYTRVSTEEQAADNTTSLKVQERKCRGLAMMRGIGAFDSMLYSDPGISGSIPLNKRPAGARLFQEAQPGDTVVAAKLDRLFRSASDALTTVEDLASRKIDLILLDLGNEPVTSNGIAKLFFTMLSAFAEFERGRIAERMADGKRAKRERNGHTGGPTPYGFRKIGTGRDAILEPNPEEMEVLRQIAIWRRHWAPGTIKRKLDNAGFKPRHGGEWDLTQIRKFMNRTKSGALNGYLGSLDNSARQ